jgi:DNA topoisomerase IB
VSESARKRAVARVVNEVSGYLGNTPAVARASYIDPRVITLYEQGITIARGHAERAVLSMLTEHPSPALEAAAGVGR